MAGALAASLAPGRVEDGSTWAADDTLKTWTACFQTLVVRGTTLPILNIISHSDLCSLLLAACGRD